MPNAFQPIELIRQLLDRQVEFVVVGGVAGTLAGSSLPTQDLDIVYDASESNVARMVELLESIHAQYRDPAGRRIVPDADKLSRFKLSLLWTDLGDLYLLREIGDGWTFDDLSTRSVEYQLDDSVVRAIDLETLIEAKTIANRDKDRYALPFLRRLLQLQREESESSE